MSVRGAQTPDPGGLHIGVETFGTLDVLASSVLPLAWRG